jgi:uncharacterized protein YgbK (DUF1537 family)
LLLAYYADDFTGATDVLEALTTAGVETALFVEPPSAQLMQRCAHVRAIGVAGNSRTMSPDEMDATLPGVFQALAAHRPQLVHYKTCSTFDSSPHVGSIGRAIDIGYGVFQNHVVPVVAGVPQLQRFCVFGNLFARSGLNSPIYRLDRHPTMSCHPVTPMLEADLRVHLSRQTSRPIELVDVVALQSRHARDVEDLVAMQRPGSILLFDTLTGDHLAVIGRLLEGMQRREKKPLFAAGSSGVEYALATLFRSTVAARQIQPVDRVLIVSGSRAPVTERQISWALEHGFSEVRLDALGLSRSRPSSAGIDGAVKRITAELDAGRFVIAHTGPTHSRVSSLARDLGTILGQILREVLHSAAVRRVAVVGGDTAGQVARALQIEALEFVAPLQPGAPLCAARSRDSDVNGLEMVFKGGQVGFDDFFGALRSGARGLEQNHG